MSLGSFFVPCIAVSEIFPYD